jgi:hypothetical protein
MEKIWHGGTGGYMFEPTRDSHVAGTSVALWQISVSLWR